jgi:hypothetical protein
MFAAFKKAIIATFWIVATGAARILQVFATVYGAKLASTAAMTAWQLPLILLAAALRIPLILVPALAAIRLWHWLDVSF